LIIKYVAIISQKLQRILLREILSQGLNLLAFPEHLFQFDHRDIIFIITNLNLHINIRQSLDHIGGSLFLKIKLFKKKNKTTFTAD